MKTSENTGALGEALAKAQGEIEAASKDAKNPHLRNKYADLASVWNACRKPLAVNGLSIIQGIATEKDGKDWILRCTTRLTHASSEWIEEILTLPVMSQKGITIAQSIGIAATYSRRYGLSAMVGIAQEGTDGGPPKDAQNKADREAEDTVTRNVAAKAARTLTIKRLLSKDKTEGFIGAAYSRALKDKVDYPYDLVKMFCVWLGKPKPSQMDDEGATKVITFLASEKGQKSWAEFEKVCGPFPGKKAKKKPEPKADAPTRISEAFTSALAEAKLTLDDVQGYCKFKNLDDPATLEGDRLVQFIGWLGNAGKAAVVDWLESQQGGE